MGKRGVGFYWKLAFTNLKGNRRVYLPYLLSSVGIIMMFYSINALGQGIDQGALYGGTTVASMMGLGVFVIGLFAVLFLFYTNSFIIKRRKKELGLYNILGMEKRHIAHILFRETLLLAVCSLALGLGLGILLSRAMFWLLGLLLGTNLAVAFVVPVSAVTGTLGLFGVIFLLTLCYNLVQVKLSKPIELLHGGETGEREPKAHWFLAVLGALLLGAGYTMYCMAVSRGERAEFLTLFDGFSLAGRIIGLHLLTGILVGLWSLLFVIPGIVAFYRYRFAPLYLYEHPDRGILEALRESCRLTRGFKASLFTLDLSYIGWGLLAYLPSVVVNFIYYNRLALNTFSGIPDPVVLPGVLGTVPAWGWVLIHGLWLLAAAPFFLPHYQCVEISYYETAKGGDAARPDPDGLGGL